MSIPVLKCISRTNIKCLFYLLPKLFFNFLKGTATLMVTMLNMKDLNNKPSNLIPVSSKSVEKRRSCGLLNIFKCTTMEAAYCRLSDVTQPY